MREKNNNQRLLDAVIGARVIDENCPPPTVEEQAHDRRGRWLLRILLAVAVIVLVVSVAQSAERSATPETVSRTLIRVGSVLSAPASEEICDQGRMTEREIFAKSKTSGQARWICRTERVITVTYGPAPVTPQPVDCSVSDWTAWNDPAWMACADGMQSRSRVRTRTITRQPANGGLACPSLAESEPQTQVCPGVAILSWTAPTRNTDGSSLTNLSGHRIAYGQSAEALSQTIQISNADLTRYIVSNLTLGTWYFAVRAYTSSGVESASSNVTSKVVP